MIDATVDPIPTTTDAHQSTFPHHPTPHKQRATLAQHKKLKNLKLSRRAKLWLTFEEPEYRSVLMPVCKGCVYVGVYTHKLMWLRGPYVFFVCVGHLSRLCQVWSGQVRPVQILPINTMRVQHPSSPPPHHHHHRLLHNSYTARLISSMLNCCIFLSVIAFVLSTMHQFQCVQRVHGLHMSVYRWMDGMVAAIGLHDVYI